MLLLLCCCGARSRVSIANDYYTGVSTARAGSKSRSQSPIVPGRCKAVAACHDEGASCAAPQAAAGLRARLRGKGDTQYDSREDVWIACACGTAMFCVYLATLYPRVPGGDSGELIAAAYQLGVGHPPGYPLFCILEKIMCSLLFWGAKTSVALRMNVGNAIIAASATAVIYLTAVPCLERSSPPAARRALAVFAAGLFGLNPCVWTYSTHAEVFALNNLLVSSLLYLTVRYMRTLDTAVARAGALVMVRSRVKINMKKMRKWLLTFTQLLCRAWGSRTSTPCSSLKFRSL